MRKSAWTILGSGLISMLALSACSSSTANGTSGTIGTTGAGAGGSTGASGSNTGSTTASAPTSSGSTTSAGVSGSSTGSASATTGSGGGACTTYDGGAGEDGGGNVATAPCGSNADCYCPLVCAFDPAVASGGSGETTICTYPCTTSADCPFITTSCETDAGACITNVCSPLGGVYYQPCDAAGKGDGTCVPMQDDNGNTYGVCTQNGTSQGICDPAGQRPDAGTLCGAAQTCVPDTNDSNGICQGECDPTTDGGCAIGSVCQGDLSTQLGLCFVVGAGGCVENSQVATELQPCVQASDCSCPDNCKFDPIVDAGFCEQPCQVTATDCPTPTTTCQNNFCGYDYCSTFGSACNSIGTNDGVCMVQGLGANDGGDPTSLVGWCIEVGTATLNNSCDSTAIRTDGTGSYCSGGLLCAISQEGSNACEVPCNPVADGGCALGEGCFAIPQNEDSFGAATNLATLAPTADTGVCSTCSQTSTPCVYSSECCTGVCDPVAQSCD